MVILLITGAIDISKFNVPFTSITNIEERLSQYIRSIEFAIDNYNQITHIVFCENTNYKYDYSILSERARLKGKFFEFLSFSGDYCSIQLKGKGYGEGEIIQYALRYSQYLGDCQSFYKLTGRIVIKNMDQIIKATFPDNAFDFYPGPIYKFSRNHIETIFFKSDKFFYLHNLNTTFKEVDESNFIYLEHLFYEQLKSFRLKTFGVFPLLSGQSGTTGKMYDKKKGELILEKFYYKIGIHNLQKNMVQKFLFHVWLATLGLYRAVK